MQGGRCCAQDTERGTFVLSSILGYQNGTSCCPNASIHILAQSNLSFGSSCGLKIFKTANMMAILDIRTKQL